ncbi:MAG: hypothetical protein M1368_05130 [Thaumarchaeota archaeon]|nr:hypothetical protein [Nitrososphaerota archaeon]
MQQVEDKLRRETSIVRLLVLLVIGVFIQYLIIAADIYPVARSVVFSPEIPIPNNVLQLIAYLVVTIVYTTTLSSLLKPKRIISPLYIQVTTSTIALIIMGAYLYQIAPAYLSGLSTTSYTIIQENYVITAFAAIFSASILGAGQNLLVRWLVGLNGDEDDIDVRSFRFTGTDIKTFAKLLINDPYLRHNGLFRRTFKKGIFYMRTFRNDRDRIILLAGPAPNQPSNSPQTHAITLATVACKLGAYTIRKDPNISEDRDNVVRHIQQKVAQLGYEMKEANNDNDVATIASKLALSEAQSRFTELKNLRTVHKILLVITLAYFVAIGYFALQNFLTASETINALIIGAAGLIFELTPWIRDTVSSRTDIFEDL